MAPGWPPPATTAWRGCGQCESRAAASEPANVQIAEPISAGKQQRSTQRSARSALTSDLRVVSPKRSLADLAWLVLAALPRQPFFSRTARAPAAEDLRDPTPAHTNGHNQPVLVLPETIS
jgi:hypothetical protein